MKKYPIPTLTSPALLRNLGRTPSEVRRTRATGKGTEVSWGITRRPLDARVGPLLLETQTPVIAHVQRVLHGPVPTDEHVRPDPSSGRYTCLLVIRDVH